MVQIKSGYWSFFTIRFVSFIASGAINIMVGKAIAKLIIQRSNVAVVNNDPIPRATAVLTAVTNPVIGNTSKKYCTYCR